MTTLSHSRGNESRDHRQAKSDGRQMMLDADFDLVVCEYGNGDVVGKRRVDDREYVLTLEFDRWVRHILPNIHRDLHHNRSDRVLLVCLPPLRTDTVERLLARKLSAPDRQKVAVVGKDQLTVSLLRSMNGSEGVNSSFFRLFREVNSEEKTVSSGYFSSGEIVTQTASQSQKGGVIG